MKKYIIYLGILAVGLLLGWMLFGGSSKQNKNHNHDAIAGTNQMWTCSMHPQIMQQELGDCPICGMELIPVDTEGNGLSINQFRMSENAMALANIQTTIVGNNSNLNDNQITLSGKISENKDETYTQPVHFSGRIEKLYIKSLGEYVSKGQATAQIYSAELIAAQQELITSYSNKTNQPQLYKAVRNKFKNWMIPDSQISEIEQSGIIQTKFTIYSNVSGNVTEIALNEGAHIVDGHSLFKVANLNTVWAEFDVYENQIKTFKIGDEISITTKANPNKNYKAKVSFIDPVLNTNTRTVTLRAILKNNNAEFKPGMFVEGTVIVNNSSLEKTLTIPVTAVLWTGERSVVYVKTNPEQPIFEMREVTIGKTMGDHILVLNGLIDGEEIVTNGIFTIDATAQLSGKKSMMNNESNNK